MIGTTSFETGRRRTRRLISPHLAITIAETGLGVGYPVLPFAG